MFWLRLYGRTLTVCHTSLLSPFFFSSWALCLVYLSESKTIPSVLCYLRLLLGIIYILRVCVPAFSCYHARFSDGLYYSFFKTKLKSCFCALCPVVFTGLSQELLFMSLRIVPRLLPLAVYCLLPCISCLLSWDFSFTVMSLVWSLPPALFWHLFCFKYIFAKDVLRTLLCPLSSGQIGAHLLWKVYFG